jgi:hypothetical protein
VKREIYAMRCARKARPFAATHDTVAGHAYIRILSGLIFAYAMYIMMRPTQAGSFKLTQQNRNKGLSPGKDATRHVSQGRHCAELALHFSNNSSDNVLLETL